LDFGSSIGELVSLSNFGARLNGWITGTTQGPGSKSIYLLLGIAGALVGARIADAVEFYFLGFGPVIGAILGAAFFVIGWRQLQAP
jgi:uncharacterized membrane protein YeaQ/YmgE (transglycosylase-associated protein family)